jgi:hypothetical protein
MANDRPAGDIYVQVTATSGLSGRAKSVVVLVPRKIIEECKSKIQGKKIDDQSTARELVDPLASYVFTHRDTFGRFDVKHSFSTTPPPEIEHESPELTRGELKAWLL